MQIAIIGTGYVGLVTGISLAVFGHTVVCVGRDNEKIKKINAGNAPFYEPGLDVLIKKVIRKKIFSATDDLKKAIQKSEIIVIAVGTPTVENKIDLSAIMKASEQIGEAMKFVKKYQVVVVKSTVLPFTTERFVGKTIEKISGKKIGQFGLCMSPEFLREGQAVEDALQPDRVVIGASDNKSGKTFAKLYKKINTPLIFTDLKTAEMTKYAANALFATLISYSNEIARICEAVGGIDAADVWKGVHLDKRLTPVIKNKRITPGVVSFIYSGCGYGGSCFPKDTKALSNFADSLGEDIPIIKNVIKTNETQPKRMISLLKDTIGDLKNKKITVLGLAFKPETDDLRESSALPIIDLLKKEQAVIFAHDPAAYADGKGKVLQELKITLTKTSTEALENSEAVLLVTSWNEYKKLTPQSFKKTMKNPVVIDGRRIFSKEKFQKAGVTYKGIGYKN